MKTVMQKERDEIFRTISYDLDASSIVMSLFDVNELVSIGRREAIKERIKYLIYENYGA